MNDKVGDAAALPSATAPFLYFDRVVSAGFHDGVANVTLEAVRYFSADGKAAQDMVIVAHLRTSLSALHSLKRAIESIESLAAPTGSGPRN
jgi:hypothetical protein